MKKKILFIALAVVLALSMGLIGCAGEEEEEEEEEEVPEEILVGDVVSYTGPYAAFGGLSAFGAEAAVEDINAEGGIYVEEYGTKIPVRWITRDCESDPLKVAPLTEDMILTEGLHFLGGGFEVPTMRQGTAVMADKYKIPAVFGAGPLESWLAMKESAGADWNYSYVFGMAIGTPAEPGDFPEDNPGYMLMPTWFAALETYAADQTNEKVACFALDDADGRAWYMAFTEIATGQGYDCYGYEEQLGIYPFGTTDFTSLIQEWKDYGCEILWGNCPGPDYGIVLQQCKVQGFEPKLVFSTRAAMFYQDIEAWGGDLPNGVGCEIMWHPSIQDAQGIGDTTPQSLVERWYEATDNQPLAQGIAWDYAVMQTLFDAIERAGTLDADAVLEALSETDLVTMWGRVVFEKERQFRRTPFQFGQWQKTDEPWVWEAPIVFSFNDFMPPTAELIFPKPWD